MSQSKQKHFKLKYTNDKSTNKPAWQVTYSLFPPFEGWDKTCCVFTSLDEPTYFKSSTTNVSNIISTISRLEKKHLDDFIFFDLGVKIPGIYSFTEVICDSLDGHTNNDVCDWWGLECPIMVYDTFKKQIGEFDVVKALAYLFPQKHPKNIIKIASSYSQSFVDSIDTGFDDVMSGKFNIVSVEEARLSGYSFTPWSKRKCAPSGFSVIRENQIIVDMFNYPNLMAQYPDDYGAESWAVENFGPVRYSLWSK